MARAKNQSNGHLEQALESLAQKMEIMAQNQATLLQTQIACAAQIAEAQKHKAETDREMAEIRRETDREMAEIRRETHKLDREMLDQRRESDKLQRENAERFARIEAILLDHSRILADHGRILEALPDAVRDRMGFKPPEKATAPS